MHRRTFLFALVSLTAAPGLASGATKPAVHVFKTRSCNCCAAWMEHLKRSGFAVEASEVEDTAPIRKMLGMPQRLASCHTATASGYALEGHVPASDIERLLQQRPKALGLAVPGMPAGSPGMETGARAEPYDVLLVHADGSSSVFSHH